MIEKYTQGPVELKDRFAAYEGSFTKGPEGSTTSTHQKVETTYDAHMTAVSQGELDAKLQLVEAKMDARVDRIEAKADSLASDINQLKWIVLGTGVSVVLGVAAFNATVLSNMVASFESGKNTAEKLTTISKDQEAREQRLDRLEQKLDEAISKKTGGK